MNVEHTSEPAVERTKKKVPITTNRFFYNTEVDGRFVETVSPVHIDHLLWVLDAYDMNNDKIIDAIVIDGANDEVPAFKVLFAKDGLFKSNYVGLIKAI